MVSGFQLFQLEFCAYLYFFLVCCMSNLSHCSYLKKKHTNLDSELSGSVSTDHYNCWTIMGIFVLPLVKALFLWEKPRDICSLYIHLLAYVVSSYIVLH